MKKLLLLILVVLTQVAFSQTLYVPSGIVGSTSNGNVGIGTSSPWAKLTLTDNAYPLQFVDGDGVANKSRYYWSLGTGVLNLSAQNDANSWVRTLVSFYHDGNVAFSGGNVGIGTTTPNYPLSIVNSASSSTYKLWVGRQNSGEGLGVAVDDGQSFITAVQDETGTETHGLTFNVLSSASGNHYTRFLINGSEKMRINSLGNVGIGTTTPSSKLTLSGSNEENGITIERTSNYDQLKIWEKDMESHIQHIENESDALKGVGMMIFETNAKEGVSPTRGGFSFKNTSGTNYITILNDGNVGIGTTNPGNYKLAVEGTIGAREVKVTTDAWADFVFQPAYKLRTLGEVEQYIKANNHLPDVPSEAEVKENGVSLGEMNAKLLQKVEELTLYVIELQKQVDELKKVEEK